MVVDIMVVGYKFPMNYGSYFEAYGYENLIIIFDTNWSGNFRISWSIYIYKINFPKQTHTPTDRGPQSILQKS